LEIPAAAQVMFKFGESGKLSGALRETGFSEAREDLRKLRWDWHGSAEEMWDYFRAITVPFMVLLEKVDGDAEVDAGVLSALGERWDGEGVRFEAEMVIATGVR
jgi:hypothetical protein